MEMVAEVREPLILNSNPNCKYLESSLWDCVHAAYNDKYKQSPDVLPGYYIVEKLGNGGREIALKGWDDRVFVVHQDYASIVLG